MTNRDDGSQEFYREGKSSMVNKMEGLEEAQQIIYEGEDDGFPIGGPNPRRRIS